MHKKHIYRTCVSCEKVVSMVVRAETVIKKWPHK